MTIQELISQLSTFPQQSEVALVDLNGLRWLLEAWHIRMDENLLIIGDKDINVEDR